MADDSSSAACVGDVRLCGGATGAAWQRQAAGRAVAPAPRRARPTRRSPWASPDWESQGNRGWERAGRTSFSRAPASCHSAVRVSRLRSFFSPVGDMRPLWARACRRAAGAAVLRACLSRAPRAPFFFWGSPVSLYRCSTAASGGGTQLRRARACRVRLRGGRGGRTAAQLRCAAPTRGMGHPAAPCAGCRVALVQAPQLMRRRRRARLSRGGGRRRVHSHWLCFARAVAAGAWDRRGDGIHARGACAGVPICLRRRQRRAGAAFRAFRRRRRRAAAAFRAV